MGPLVLAVVLLVAGLPGQAQRGASAGLDEAMRLASEGQHAEAAAALAKLAAAHPDSAEIRFRLGTVLLRQAKGKEALEQLESAAKLEANVAAIWLALAQARLQEGLGKQANEAAGRALALAPADTNIGRGLGMLHGQMARQARAGKNPGLAIEHWQTAMRLDPTNPRHPLEAAQMFLDHRTFEPAIAILERSWRRFPDNGEVLHLLGVAHYGAGNEQKAVDAFLKLTDLNPGSAIGYASLETLLPGAGSRLNEIIEKLRAFSQRDPASPLGPFLLALAIAVRTPDSAELQPLLQKAIERQAKFWPAYFELHKVYANREEWKEAVRLLEKTIELEPQHAPAHFGLAQGYLRLGDRERAAQYRQLHHQLLTRQREQAEALRADAPMLPYRLVER
jgi:tetratricopeptide (TPR) repeat protein